MNKLLIVSDSQGKWFNEYIHEFAENELEVDVNFKSGRKIEEVDRSIVEKTRECSDVVLHLGTNNIPNRKLTPHDIVTRMRKTVDDILLLNASCRIYISSVLPRQRDDYKFGAERQRLQDCSDYRRHLEFIDYCNSKAAVTNILMRQQLSTIPNCHFINNDAVFLGQNGVVRRHLLSRDGLHLPPAGIRSLLGSIIQHVVRIINSHHSSPSPNSLPSPPLSWMIFNLLPSVPSLVTKSEVCESPQSRASSCGSSIQSDIVDQGKSYRDALLVPALFGKLTSTVNPTQGKKLIKSKLKITKPPQLLPSSTSKPPSKPNPYHFSQVTRNKGSVFPSSVKHIHSSSSEVDCKLFPACNCNCLLHSFPLANRFSSLTNFTSCEESATSQGHAKSFFSNSSNSSCSAGNSLPSSTKRRRRRPRRFQQHKSNLFGKGIERTERKQTTSHEVKVVERGHCGVYMELDEVSCADAVERAPGYKYANPRSPMPYSIEKGHGGIHEARTVPKILFQEGGLMLSQDRAGGDGNTSSQPNHSHQSICVVASGRISQNNINLFSEFSNNNQCVCISTVNIVYISNVSRNIFTKDSIDHIIISGDLYYRQSKQKLGPSHTHAHLMVEEIADILEFNDKKFKIEHEMVACGVYSENAIGLTNTLQQIFLKDSRSGYIFLGQGAAVSMWRDGDFLYMFNSHSVDEFNRFAHSGKGHVFRIHNEMNLAHLLLTNANLSNNLDLISSIYQVYRISPSLVLEIPGEIVDSKDYSMIEVDSSDDKPLIHLAKKFKLDIPVLDDIDSVDPVAYDAVDIYSSDNQPSYNEPLINLVRKSHSIDSVPPVACDTVEIYSSDNHPSDDVPLINLVKKSTKKTPSKEKGLIVDSFSSSDEHPSENEPLIFLVRKINNNDFTETVPKKKGGRPPKTKRGRPKTSDLSKEEQHRKAVDTYTKKNKDVHRKAVEKYSQNNPDVNRNSVQKYSQNNPDVNRKSVQKYSQNNPDVNRKSVQKYSQNNPDVNRKSVQKYSQNNPDVNRKSVQKYSQNNPDVNRKSVQAYSQNNPDINRKTSKTYNQNHPEANRKTSTTYRDKNNPEYHNNDRNRNRARHLPKELRNNGLVAEYSGEKLKLIKPFELKNKSLLSDNCSRCSHCKARLFEEELESKMWCCSGGSAVITLPPLTGELYNNKDFLARSIQYNRLFQFCVTDVNLEGMKKDGLTFLKIKGNVYHNVPPIERSRFNMGNFFIDNDDIQSVEPNTEKEVQRQIFTHLHSCKNPYLDGYKRLYLEPSKEARLVFQKTSRATHGPILGDQPTTSEVAAYIDCSETVEYNSRSVTVWKVADKSSYKIYSNSPLLEPMSYPLLYPHGTPGWSPEMLDKKGKRLSLLRYTRNLLLSDDRFSKFGRLSETWLVDMYSRIEEGRLSFFTKTQNAAYGKGLRTATADEIQKNIQERDEMGQHIQEDETIQGEGGILPGRVYLPQSFTGGPRYMRKAYLDAMGIVSQLGGPTYFLTFTALGHWDEVKLSKHNSQKQQPDVVDRVFHKKFLELLRDIRTIFGDSLYIVWSIEFQMRGLPHAHICFRVKDGGPASGPEIDRIIRADIPSHDEADGELRRLVLKHMVHGPCGHGYRTNLPCWSNEEEKCNKHFPKSYVDNTFIDDKGFVQYKRTRNNRAEIPWGNGKFVTVDNRWIVPYNPFLLLKYRCHINLELASASRVVKYLFKYISKGPSLRRVAVEVVPGQDDREKEVNEIDEYVTQRYIGSSDAAWRVLSFDMTGREPAVIALPVYLKGKNCIIFKAGEEEKALQSSQNLLEIYFTRPNNDKFRNCTYMEFYSNFQVHSSRPRTKCDLWEHPNGRHFITKRKATRVSRLFWVYPGFVEQYYLRLLLSKFPCFGYENLLELGGNGCKSFQEAARALGLVDDGNEYSIALGEASGFMLGPQLRKFFVLLVTEGAPALELWNQYSEKLIDTLCEDEALLDIDRGLRRRGLSLVDVGLRHVMDKTTELGREQVRYTKDKELCEITRTVDEWENKLSEDQSTVLEYLRELMEDESSLLNRVIFLDGPGGSGKTLLLKVISALFRLNKKIVLCVATSGIAALNLPGGTTAHSMFMYPLEPTVNDYWRVSNGSQRAELIRHASLIIYDEAPMANRIVIEMLDRSLQDLMNNTVPFGGKIVIFSGDFRQIPPVIKKSHGSREIVKASLSRSTIWKGVKTFKLSTSHRIADNIEYSQFILKLGSAQIQPKTIDLGENRSELLVALPLLSYVETVEELIKFVFPEEVLVNPNLSAARAILSTCNSNVEQINNLVLKDESLPGNIVRLYSRDKVVDNDGYQIDDFLLHHARAQGVPDHVLELKVGAVCLIMRNLNFDLGLVNGTKVIIDEIKRKCIVCTKPGSIDRYAIPRISFKFPLGVNSTIEVLRIQYPLKLAYAMTIHKSQGQTLDFVGLDLRFSCFTHGQLYVALSRARSPANIRLLVPDSYIVDGVAHAKNIVYTKLIDNVV